MKKHYRTENDCLNCGATLQGKYCHVCGQENLELKESFGHMMNHAISDYFHFDHQFFHTLKPLLFKPGFLTNEYMGGRRAQYLHPVKMYIFISIVYFLLYFKTGHDVANINETNNNPVKTEKALDSTKKIIASNAYIPGPAKKQIEQELDKEKAQSKKGVSKNLDIDNKGPNKWFHPTTKDTSYAQYLASQKKLPDDGQDNFLLEQWNKKVYDYRQRYGNQAREMFMEDIQHNTPKMMFLLLPLFALILRVSFWKNRKFYVEHLIFSFHFHCFLFLFLGILILLQWFIPPSWTVVIGWLIFAEVLYITWYVFRSLRVVYHRSIFRTITKMIGMWFMYFLTFSLCVSLLFLITAIF